MLGQLPRALCEISVRELCQRLSDTDFQVTERTVQRDLA